MKHEVGIYYHHQYYGNCHSIFLEVDIKITRRIGWDCMLSSILEDHAERVTFELPDFGYYLNQEERYHMTSNEGRKEMRKSCREEGNKYLRELVYAKLAELEKQVPYFRIRKSNIAIFAEPNWFGDLYCCLDQH